jgi:hypothetical protein
MFPLRFERRVMFREPGLSQRQQRGVWWGNGKRGEGERRHVERGKCLA